MATEDDALLNRITVDLRIFGGKPVSRVRGLSVEELFAGGTDFLRVGPVSPDREVRTPK